MYNLFELSCKNKYEGKLIFLQFNWCIYIFLILCLIMTGSVLHKQEAEVSKINQT